MIRKYLVFIIFSMFFCRKGMAQVDQSMLDEVLKSKNKTKEHSFKKTKSYGEVNIIINYIGKIKTKSTTYKVLKYTIHYNNEDTFRSSILFFNNSDEFLGRYSFGNAKKIVAKIKGQKIIFDNTEDYCDSSTKNELDISNGLPEEFRTKCDNKFGDIRRMESDY